MSGQHDVLTDVDRYAPGMKEQLANLRAALASGMPRRGWKVGINVPEVLSHLKLSHSGVGWLRGDRIYESGAQLNPRAGDVFAIEPEIAIRLAHDLSAGASHDDALASIAGVSPAFEVVNYTRPKGGLDEIVAHAFFHEASVIGPLFPLAKATALGECWPVLTSEGRECPKARADLVPKDLADHVLFVAAFLEFFGESLGEGDMILSGSYTASAVDASKPLDLSADFGPLGSIQVSIGPAT